jgi:capsular exopolysaccharide synthesis family protein
MQLLTTDQSAERGTRGLSLGPEARPGAESSAQFAGFVKGREQIQILKAERADLSQYLQDKHPKMVKLTEEIARMENLLEIYRQQNQESLVSARQSLELQIRNLEDSIKEWEGKAAESSRKMAEHQRLQLNVKRQQELYDRLLNLIQSVGVNKNLDQENVSIMENASAAFPVRSNVLQRLLLAALGGLLAGLGILYFIDRHDDRVSSVTELMGLFEFPVVGHVPAMPEVKGRPNLELIHAHDPRHSYVECFRDIRSALLFASSDSVRPRTILVTSAIPNEGKSTVSANLAVTLALSGARVLLIDADLRCGTLHQLFGLATEPGLSELLLKQAHVQDCIKATGTPNLYVITCGHALVNPGELFLQPGTEAMLRELREQFDYVILDSAPVLATADTCSLAPKVDGVLVIMRGAFTSARLTRQALDFLVQRQIKVLGLILNRVDTSFPEYYQYKYGKYYHSNAAKRT